MSTHEPTGHWIVSWSGTCPALRLHSHWVGCRCQLIDVSLSLSPLHFSLSQTNEMKYFLKRKIHFVALNMGPIRGEFCIGRVNTLTHQILSSLPPGLCVCYLVCPFFRPPSGADCSPIGDVSSDDGYIPGVLRWSWERTGKPGLGAATDRMAPGTPHGETVRGLRVVAQALQKIPALGGLGPPPERAHN